MGEFHGSPESMMERLDSIKQYLQTHIFLRMLLAEVENSIIIVNGCDQHTVMHVKQWLKMHGSKMFLRIIFACEVEKNVFSVSGCDHHIIM